MLILFFFCLKNTSSAVSYRDVFVHNLSPTTADFGHKTRSLSSTPTNSAHKQTSPPMAKSGNVFAISKFKSFEV